VYCSVYITAVMHLRGSTKKMQSLVDPTKDGRRSTRYIYMKRELITAFNLLLIVTCIVYHKYPTNVMYTYCNGGEHHGKNAEGKLTTPKNQLPPSILWQRSSADLFHEKPHGVKSFVQKLRQEIAGLHKSFIIVLYSIQGGHISKTQPY
jgi:hypothetical protein